MKKGLARKRAVTAFGAAAYALLAALGETAEYDLEFDFD